MELKLQLAVEAYEASRDRDTVMHHYWVKEAGDPEAVGEYFPTGEDRDGVPLYRNQHGLVLSREQHGKDSYSGLAKAVVAGFGPVLSCFRGFSLVFAGDLTSEVGSSAACKSAGPCTAPSATTSRRPPWDGRPWILKGLTAAAGVYGARTAAGGALLHPGGL